MQTTEPLYSSKFKNLAFRVLRKTHGFRVIFRPDFQSYTNLIPILYQWTPSVRFKKKLKENLKKYPYVIRNYKKLQSPGGHLLSKKLIFFQKNVRLHPLPRLLSVGQKIF